MYAVKVYPESISPFVAQIYAGLYDLAAAGKIKLDYAKDFFHKTRKFNKYMPYTLWLEITDLKNGRCRKICFDMIDGMNIASMECLNKADIYVKRSYCQSFINELKQGLDKKIIPFGLHYDCNSRNETVMMRMRHVYLYHLIHKNFLKNPILACKQTFGQPLKLLLRNHKRSKSMVHFSLLVNEFEVHPAMPAESKIFFRTRVYSPKQAPNTERLKEVNEMRADTIRALRKHFGRQFVGGLQHSAFTLKYYPDLISEILNKKEHIHLGKKHLICVNTSGLHDSTGWKLPEYLAASRCIVSEPLKFELPVPLEKGKHYLPFTTPDECVDACRRILSDTKLVSSMRQENYIYYKNHVKPSKIMLRCLETAISKGSGK